VWRLFRNRLPTKDNLVRRRILQVQEAVCVAGCGEIKSATHLFLNCDTFSSLWAHLLQWLGLSTVLSGDIRHHFTQFTYMAGLPRPTHSYLRIIWFASMWTIWKERNNCVFQHSVSYPSSVAEKVKLLSFLWLTSKQTTFSYTFHDWWKHSLLCMGVQM